MPENGLCRTNKIVVPLRNLLSSNLSVHPTWRGGFFFQKQFCAKLTSAKAFYPSCQMTFSLKSGCRLMSSMPLYFKIIFLCFGLTVITGSIRFFSKGKTISKYIEFSDEKKNSVIDFYSRLIRYYKIIIWIAPFVSALILYCTYMYSRHDFLYTLSVLVLSFILISEDFLYRKSILNKVKKNTKP